MDFFYDIEGDGERYSFDSDGFDEESICSWISEPESLCNVWRGWTWKNNSKHSSYNNQHQSNGTISSLIELSAKAVAAHIPFAVVESYPEPIPEDLQLKIAFWSFPDSEEDIRLYSCLANGSPEEFNKGEALFKNGSVKDALQIGFHLSGLVCPPQTAQNTLLKDGYRTSVVFDRQRITANNCTCDQSAWCQHIVAICLHRVNQAKQVKLRAPISESLSRLDRSQLQKFAQYLIHELQDKQILPHAQRLLDELLSTLPSAINKLDGAPDPTAGPEGDTHAAWYMDQRILHENIKKTLVKFCVPSPVVYSDLNCLSSSAPPAAAEWQSLLRPLRGREPEGIWNLLSIVRELLRRQDSNAVPLLEILTDEMLQCEQLLVWWFTTKISSAHNSVTLSKTNGSNSNSAQNAASSLCDEIVTLWRLVALNPRLSPVQRDDLRSQLETWHIMTLDKVRTAKCNNSSKKDDIELFPGFKSAYEVTYIDWSDYSIDGVTYSESSTAYQIDSTVPGQTCLTSDSCCAASKISPVTNYKVDNSKYSFANEQGFRPPVAEPAGAVADESSGSEGFCDQEPRGAGAELHEGENVERDSDWSDEGIKVNKDGYMAADDDSDLDMSVLIPSTSNSSPSTDTAENILPPVLGAAAAPPLPQVVATAASRVVGNVLPLEPRDDYSMYQYDTTLRLELPPLENKADEPNYFAGIKKWNDEKEILFARAEALHAHGYVQQACELASKLARDMLAEGEEMAENGTKVKRHKQSEFYPPLTASMSFSNTPPAKAAFLCTVLQEDAAYHHLAFKVGMYGLEMHREPAPSKALEVKLANQESELVSLLKRLPLGYAELNVIRERAEQLRDGTLRSRGEAHLPLMLTTFIFESLCLPALNSNGATGSSNAASSSGTGSRPPSRCVQINATRLPSDELLGFDAAVTALGLKANISEAQHPLICEGTRRQKGDLAIALLVQYKDDQYKLDKILEKLLDKEIHQLFKAPPISSYLSPAGAKASSSSTSGGRHPQGPSDDMNGLSNHLVNMTMEEPRGDNVVRPKVNRTQTRPNQLEDPGLEDLEGRNMDARFRCGIYGRSKRPSVGMAAVDSSAPETTSSDNSPTVVRRPFAKHSMGGAGSDSESSGRSSDSVGSGSSIPRLNRPRNSDSPSQRYQYSLEPRSMKNHNFRNKGKTRATPTEPNQPSEALAHFMFELAKSLLSKAGGSSSTSVMFTQRDHAAQTQTTHRLLHLCAFQVGLYALGINNCVSKNWLSRTYSSHVSWITGQAIEIGTVAVNILLDTWEGHLTPTEVATLTDKASRGRDPNMVSAAAELALSCLAHAQALNPQETKRALLQCKEQSNNMLEKACKAVESAAKDGSVSPEVLFDVAKRWFELYEESRQNQIEHEPQSQHNDMQLQSNGQQQQQPSSIPRNNSNPHMMMAATTTMEQSMASMIPTPATVTMAGVFRGQFPQAMGQMSQAGFHPMYNAAFMYNIPAQYPSVQGQPLQQMPGGGFVTAPGVAFPFNQQFQMGASVPQNNGGNMYQAMGSPAAAMFNTANMVTMANNMPAQMLPAVNQQANTGHLPQHPSQQFALAQNSEQFNYVMSAYRVGMLALETYGRRISDERPQTKYHRNPSCREDIKWLLALSMKLGPNYLQQFCQNAVHSLFSPFILYDIAMEVFSAQTRNNPALNPAQIQTLFSRTPMLSSLMQRCLQMYIQCSHHRIHHIQPADYDEFVSIVSSARKAFSMMPSGMVQFQEMLQGLRRNKSCKKELWTRIMNGLSLSS